MRARIGMLGLGLMLGAAGGAAAQDGAGRVDDHALVSYGARWDQRPSAEEIAAAAPAGATGGGMVNLRCVVMDDGTLASCRTQEVEPAGQGFEAAALSLTGRYRMAEAFRPPKGLEARPYIGFAMRIGRAGETRYPCLPPACFAHPVPRPPPPPPAKTP